MRSLLSLAAICVVVFTTPLLAQSDTCLAHYQESGSIFIGKVFDTYQDFPGIDKETALHRLESQLQDAGVSIASVDGEAGTIKGKRKDPLLSYPFPVEFTVTSTASGVHVRLWLKTLAGQVPIGRFKHGICDMFKLVAIEPPREPQPDAATANQEAVNPSPSDPAPDTKADAQARASEGDERDKPLTAEEIAKLTGGSSDDHGGGGGKEEASSHKKKEQKALTNDDVIKLVKADLGDKVVIDKINASPGDKLDTSTEALIRLKKAGVSKAVIDAMIKRGDE